MEQSGGAYFLMEQSGGAYSLMEKSGGGHFKIVPTKMDLKKRFILHGRALTIRDILFYLSLKRRLLHCNSPSIEWNPDQTIIHELPPFQVRYQFLVLVDNLSFSWTRACHGLLDLRFCCNLFFTLLSAGIMEMKKRAEG